MSLQLQCTDPTECLWIHGPTGSGKTEYCYRIEDAYFVPLYIPSDVKKWWCYKGETTLVMDDVDHSTKRTACRVLDDFLEQGTFHARRMIATPKRIIVTSMYTPSELWKSDIFLSKLRAKFRTVEFNLQEQHD